MRVILPLLFLIVLFCVGCFQTENTKVAGVDDFPNSIQARVNGFLEESKKSDEIVAVSPSSNTTLSTPGFSVGALKRAAGKISASTINTKRLMFTLSPSLSDTNEGCPNTLKWDTTQISITKTTVTSVTFCADEKLLDTIPKNETVLIAKSTTTYINGRIETAEYIDEDGDGKINPVPGKSSKVKLVLTTLENGVFEKTEMSIGPGDDSNFDMEEDNVTYSINWIKTNKNGTDTLGMAVYSDADSDGFVLNNKVPSLVDLYLFEKGPTQKNPDALWTKIQTRMLIVYGLDFNDSKRVHFEVATIGGKIQIADILNKSGGADFNMRDTVIAHFLEKNTSPTDTVDSMESGLKMKVGKDLDDKTDDSVFAIEIRVVKKLGNEKKARFTFISDKPIPSGKDPSQGTLSMQVDYTDGTFLKVDGRLTTTNLDIIAEFPNGTKKHVVWDSQGRGLILETVP